MDDDDDDSLSNTFDGRILLMVLKSTSLCWEEVEI